MSSAPTPAVAPNPSSERRVAPRRQPAMGTVCRLDSPDGGPSALALVWNISQSGISMLLNAPQPAGTVLAGYLESMVSDAMLRIAMKVVHVKPLDTGDYFIGAHFENPIAADDMKPFIAEE
ncbi:PilZ domain-containing protein [Gemmata sp. G18]|uniref:PilZ domain-containing protein n=1 Tax=Gemmata palustris TaxID=2822762 RepID=A0ABS5BMX6_9BACT|nr:PilZ domain-containing protein [Gemmata palustris]MBP3954238.1 PilZ domain-containing protein [Gemmata palustris]